MASPWVSSTFVHCSRRHSARARAQHARREIDAVDFAAGPDRLAQEGKVATGATSDFQHAVARLQVQPSGRASAQMRGEKEQSVEYADQAGNTIVALRDERAVAIRPLGGHVVAPARRGCYFLPLPPLEMFPPFHAVIVEAVVSQTVKRERAER